VVAVAGVGQLYGVYDSDGPTGSEFPQYLDTSLLAWSSSNKNIASVDSQGKVTGKKAGSVTITADYKRKKIKAVAQVKVAGTISALDVQTPDERTRSYLLYIPADYHAGTPTSLVIGFHGGGGDGQRLMDKSQLNVLADQYGFLVAYPNGTGFFGSWNGGSCCGYAVKNTVDDVGFTSVLISDIQAKFSVDDQRVYVTGMSNGAILAHRLACELSTRIAAIAPVAGGMNLGGDFTACTPTRPMSLMEFHGKTDDNYPYLGGEGPDDVSGTDFYPIPSTITDWLARNDMSESSGTISYEEGIVTCESHTSVAAEVTLCTADPPVKQKVDGVVYDGGGHAWPGGVKDRREEADIPTPDISASAAMWNFFKVHPKP